MPEIPTTIHRSQLLVEDRARTVYSGIEDLAESLIQNGMIQPLVLVATDNPEQFKLEDGGRRTAALDSLLSEQKWDGLLHHAASSQSSPFRPGFVVRGQETDKQVNEITSLLVELHANKDRVDFDWRDEAKLVAKLFTLARKQAHLEGKDVDLRILATGFRCGYNDLRAAIHIHDELVRNPEKFKDCTTVRNAYSLLLRESAQAVEKLMATKSQGTAPAPTIPLIVRKDADGAVPFPPVFINLANQFLHTSGLNFVSALKLSNTYVDHIICDPDYGVSVERLEASVSDAASGVAQKSIDQTLEELRGFITTAFYVTRGTLCLWHDPDHWEKLRDWCRASGFAVQRWPIIWHKVDYNSNQAPQFNTTKDYEQVLIARKPGIALHNSGDKVTKSVWSIPSGATVKNFGHPFAKPVALWKKLIGLVASPGQSILDPFAGSCSSLVSAVEMGMEIHGCEVQEVHYNRGRLNLETSYLNQFPGRDVTFL